MRWACRSEGSRSARSKRRRSEIQQRTRQKFCRRRRGSGCCGRLCGLEEVASRAAVLFEMVDDGLEAAAFVDDVVQPRPEQIIARRAIRLSWLHHPPSSMSCQQRITLRRQMGRARAPEAVRNPSCHRMVVPALQHASATFRAGIGHRRLPPTSPLYPLESQSMKRQPTDRLRTKNR